MEMVFYCADCSKFFYSIFDDDHLFADCPHCGSKMTASTQAPKRWYEIQSNETKTAFKQRIRDEYTEEFVDKHQKMLQVQQQKRERLLQQQQEHALDRQLRLESFMLTTSCSFDGYVVTEYIDVMFDEMLVGLGFGKSIVSSIDNLFSAVTGTEATTMISKLNDVKDQLKKRLVQKAVDIGANAMLGIDFESSKLGDLIMVSMTGTAVKVEKLPGAAGNENT